MIILIDNGHGSDTKGKHSPDGRLKEYLWARDVAKRIQAKLKSLGYDARLIVPETRDISLRERTRRVNDICRQVGSKKSLLISVHNNAAGADGKWHTASGWSGFVAPNASDKSKRLAQFLYAEAEKAGLRGNRAVPPCKYWVGNFAIIRDTSCPAVLTENLFQDNREEVEYLLSESGKNIIADIHVQAIKKYINTPL